VLENHFKYLGRQREVLDRRQSLAYFKASNYVGCRINAYPAYTVYQGINLTASSFIMIDLDLENSENSVKKLDKIVNKTLKKLTETFHGANPTVPRTGNGYHVYQPVQGIILEEALLHKSYYSFAHYLHVFTSW
jgi:hypothetical protein